MPACEYHTFKEKKYRTARRAKGTRARAENKSAQDGYSERETRKRECSSYGLSATKHPLNNSVINSPGRLRRPVPPLVSLPPLSLPLSTYAPETARRLQEYERKELAALVAFILRHFCMLSFSLSRTPFFPLSLPLFLFTPVYSACTCSSLIRYYPLICDSTKSLAKSPNSSLNYV